MPPQFMTILVLKSGTNDDLYMQLTLTRSNLLSLFRPDFFHLTNFSSHSLSILLSLCKFWESRLCGIFAASMLSNQAIPITLSHSSCLLSAVTWFRLKQLESVWIYCRRNATLLHLFLWVIFVVYLPRKCCATRLLHCACLLSPSTRSRWVIFEYFLFGTLHCKGANLQ